MKCFDSNNTTLHVGDYVMCVTNGHEYEGSIMTILKGNKVVIDSCDGEVLTVDGKECFYLP